MGDPMPTSPDTFDPLAVVADWLDACRWRELDALLNLYDERATLECDCEHIRLTGANGLRPTGLRGPTAPGRPRPRCLEEVRGRPDSKANRLRGFKAKKQRISALKNCRIRASLAHEQRFQVDCLFLLPALRNYLHGEPARAVRATPRLLSLPCVRCSGPRMERAL